MDILKRLEVIFRDVFDDENIVLTNETTANEIVAIRREFKINFDLEEVSKYKNVGDMVKAIKEKLGE